jgi:predicted nucleic acid-binding protein
MSTEPRLLIVDASVAVKWLLPELDSGHAECLLDDQFRLFAPDLLPIEVANGLWKEARAEGISPAEAEARLTAFREFRVTLHPSSDLLAVALEIALETDRTVYDCLYLALAQRERGVLVTADDRFLGGLGRTRYVGSVRHLADMGFDPDPE